MPALQCPDCGSRHPLDEYADRAAFRCSGCGRTLKVPDQFRRDVAPPAAGDGSDATRVAPVASPPTTTAYHRPAPPRSIEVVPKGAPLVARFGLWVLAIPVSLWLTYRIARGVGVLTADQVEDVFFDQDWGRFWPLARLLPLWALLAALAVHFGVLGIERYRRSRAEARVAPRRGAVRASTPEVDVTPPARALDDATGTAG
ncbi:MAG TPA: hypothetical protein VFZ83_08835 [Acidimicrobiia bacterium]|nr:hypothetical protein [Acidimicrobiia bacterium]